MVACEGVCRPNAVQYAGYEEGIRRGGGSDEVSLGCFGTNMAQCVQRYAGPMVEDGDREGGLGECERFGAGGMVWDFGE